MSSVKHDTGKPRWDLLPFREIGQVVDILTFGASKYAPDAWQELPDFENRYFAATMRHLAAYRQGEVFDRESGLSHLAHAACNLLFLLWDQNEHARIDREGEDR